jgi:hypothetical protein
MPSATSRLWERLRFLLYYARTTTVEDWVYDLGAFVWEGIPQALFSPHLVAIGRMRQAKYVNAPAGWKLDDVVYDEAFQRHFLENARLIDDDLPRRAIRAPATIRPRTRRRRSARSRRAKATASDGPADPPARSAGAPAAGDAPKQSHAALAAGQMEKSNSHLGLTNPHAPRTDARPFTAGVS